MTDSIETSVESRHFKHVTTSRAALHGFSEVAGVQVIVFDPPRAYRILSAKLNDQDATRVHAIFDERYGGDEADPHDHVVTFRDLTMAGA